MKNLMLDHVGYQLWICHLWQKKNGKENRCNFLMFDILESYPNPLKHKTTLAAIVIQGA